ncbi:hypothetical protein [Alkalilimnicola ehrlichii]|nr:hypothetical protein [Alkalilimnicola ehrlichii]
MQKVALFVFLSMFISSCATFSDAKIQSVQYFESLELAPPHTAISIYECYGGASLRELLLFKMPTYESAVRECKIEALRQGGDAIIYLYSMRAVDVPGEAIDVLGIFLEYGQMLSVESSNSHKAFEAAGKVEFSDDEEQLAWFFKIVRLEH